jgi:hypothetical protein
VFNRSNILSRFPWLAQRNRRMIIGNDLDALLSAQFLHDYLGWSIAGFYNYSTIYFDPKTDLRECVWVDLDIYHADIASIGHHILKSSATDRIPSHRLSLNPNLLRGIDQADFKHKYPLGTIHLLLWLHDQSIKNRRPATLMLWLADSTWINAQIYRDNVKAWLQEWLPVGELINTFDQTATGEFEEEMRDQVLSKIDIAELAEDDNIQRRSKHLDLGGHQCVWNRPDELPKVMRVIDLIQRRFGWDAPSFPREFKAIEGVRRSAKLPDLVAKYGSLDKFLDAEKVFSYVIPNKDRINYTTEIKI